MKAIVWTKYGSPDGLQLKEVQKPTPQDNEVLIRIHATTVTTADCELRNFKISSVFWLPLRLYMGFIKPTRVTILGQELAGEIEAVGKDVTRFKKGDRVFAWTGLHLGGYAEYTCLRETATIAIKPSNMTYAEAAAVPLGGLEAWHYLHGNVRAGQKVLIVGAAGTIGTFAVQLAKYFGAEVTGVDSPEKLDTLRAIGVDHVIDYTREDFAKNGQTYDLIFDAPGKSSFSRSKKSLKPNGQYLSANPGTSQQIRGIAKSITRPEKAGSEYTSRRKDDLISLRELIEAGKITSVIDRYYPLEQTAEAHRYVEAGYKKGNVVITVEENGKT